MPVAPKQSPRHCSPESGPIGGPWGGDAGRDFPGHPGTMAQGRDIPSAQNTCACSLSITVVFAPICWLPPRGPLWETAVPSAAGPCHPSVSPSPLPSRPARALCHRELCVVLVWAAPASRARKRRRRGFSWGRAHVLHGGGPALTLQVAPTIPSPMPVPVTLGFFQRALGGCLLDSHPTPVFPHKPEEG